MIDETHVKQEAEDRGANRSHRPTSRAFREFIAKGWAERPAADPRQLPVAPFAAERRAALSAKFPGARLVIPAGPLKVRSNDSDYRFRPHSAFAHLTGFSADQEPDAVLVMEPHDDGHDAVLFFRPRAERDTEEFYADARYGELWVGVRPSLEEIENQFGITARHLDEAKDAVTKDAAGIQVLIVREADLLYDGLLDAARSAAGRDLEAEITADAELNQEVSELRLIKDDYEAEQMREAVAITATGFDEIVKALPEALRHRRGERVVQGAFEAHARTEGYGVGYDTIAASGNHACTLHWIRNDGAMDESDLILVDAGAEADSLYTADVTRTIPLSGTFSEQQRKVYEAVLEAADAAFELAAQHATRTVLFKDVHAAAMKVITARLEEWGLLPGTAEESLDPEGQFHRRWMVHGTSHHLGIDVHDCAQARREMYLDAKLTEGMVFTIEPGLYFKADDLLAPEELRGIGVRIEDDILLTSSGAENLSLAIPRTLADVEAWVSGLRA
ncbi:aminopeptidase P family protein [Saxibacter everestensis]|uniref:Xaa-Pro aminopeptidase n=1 Tax=Saxibacter everestensis TaxID=2909229 RepID=A0ABY8QQ86_9MICO|nr:aminopeptidase P family protein [Brevibacteriaceae bacterium ZFBP1038]